MSGLVVHETCKPGFGPSAFKGHTKCALIVGIEHRKNLSEPRR